MTSGELMAQLQLLQLVMAGIFFLCGVIMLIGGMAIVMNRIYRETMRMMSAQSGRLQGKSLIDLGVPAAIETTISLATVVSRLLHTALGIGIFLAVLGAAICTASFWMTTQIIP
ncbi:MAG: hypothetical protein RLY87_36 [Chloroflexota bacterium]